MNWFTRRGIFFVPSSPIGWAFIVIAVGYSVYAFIEINSRSNSMGDTFFTWIFNVVLIFAALYGVAWMSTKKPSEE
jgi:membrane protein DedA with SNARE-associated domain